MHRTRGTDRLPRVTACMPAWNSAAFIEPVLDALAAQTYANLHIIISVDECSDGTAEICEAFAARRPNATVIRQPQRLGWVGNSNALLHAAHGDYVFFAFHDDPLHPDFTARLVDALERAPNAVLAFCDMDTNLGPFHYDALEGIGDPFERARRILRREGTWWVPNHGLIRVSAVRALGGMRRHLAGEFSADLSWMLRLALLGEFVRVPEALVSKAFRPAGLSSTWRKGAWNRIGLQLDCMRAIREARFSSAREMRLHAVAAGMLVEIELRTLKHRIVRRRRASPASTA